MVVQEVSNEYCNNNRINGTDTSSQRKAQLFGLVRGEFFKIMRQWTTWILLVMLAGVIILPYIIEFTVPNLANQIHRQSVTFLL